MATATARDLIKPEHALNKRRRILAVSKSIRRGASFASLVATREEEKPEEEEEDSGSSIASSSSSSLIADPKPIDDERNEKCSKKKAFISPRCFSLSDLQRA